MPLQPYPNVSSPTGQETAMGWNIRRLPSDRAIHPSGFQGGMNGPFSVMELLPGRDTAGR